MDLRQRLVERLSKAAARGGRIVSISRQRKFLINCLQDFNYITPVRHESDSESEDEYRYFNTPNEPERGNIQKKSITSNRTFILGPGGDRLSELQKRGISSEESELNKVNNQIDSVLNVLLQKNINMDTVGIKQRALNMYQDIRTYYSEGNPYNFKQIKGSLKRGYIALVIIYSTNIPESDIIDILGISISDLPEARKNIKRIFKDIPGYEFLLLKGKSKFCNIPLPPEILNTVNGLINNFSIFTKEFMVACINYVCNKMYQKRIKILIDNEMKFVTYSLLEEYCGVSQNIIKKNTDFILNTVIS
jgi:hypothetical protein